MAIDIKQTSIPNVSGRIVPEIDRDRGPQTSLMVKLFEAQFERVIRPGTLAEIQTRIVISWDGTQEFIPIVTLIHFPIRLIKGDAIMFAIVKILFEENRRRIYLAQGVCPGRCRNDRSRKCGNRCWSGG